MYLVDTTSKVNIVLNILFELVLSELGVLNWADITVTLKTILKTQSDILGYVVTLSKYANGYHYWYDSKTEPVFDMDTN